MSSTDLHIPELGDKFKDYRQEIWGNSYTWAWERRSDEIKHLVIHHSVTAHDATPDYIAQLHKNRGWGGIGYHFVVTKDGVVWYVGDIGTARANVADMNEKVIGVCLVGDFTKHLPTDEQIISSHKLCKYFISIDSVPNVKTWDEVVGHKDLAPTACPGTSWDKSADGDMFWRIKTGTPYSPPEEEEPDPLEACTERVKKLSDQLTEEIDNGASLQKAVTSLKGKLAAQDETVFQQAEENRKLVMANEKQGIALNNLEKRIGILEEENKRLKSSLEAPLEAQIKGLGFFKLLKIYFSKEVIK